MSSNYPPGVTGNEWQIAGADEWEGTRSVECTACGLEQDAEGTYSGDRWTANFWAECTECGAEIDIEDIDVSDQFEPDPDYLMELAREQAWEDAD